MRLPAGWAGPWVFDLLPHQTARQASNHHKQLLGRDPAKPQTTTSAHTRQELAGRAARQPHTALSTKPTNLPPTQYHTLPVLDNGSLAGTPAPNHERHPPNAIRTTRRSHNKPHTIPPKDHGCAPTTTPPKRRQGEHAGKSWCLKHAGAFPGRPLSAGRGYLGDDLHGGVLQYGKAARPQPDRGRMCGGNTIWKDILGGCFGTDPAHTNKRLEGTYHTSGLGVGIWMDGSWPAEWESGRSLRRGIGGLLMVSGTGLPDTL